MLDETPDDARHDAPASTLEVAQLAFNLEVLELIRTVLRLEIDGVALPHDKEKHANGVRLATTLTASEFYTNTIERSNPYHKTPTPYTIMPLSPHVEQEVSGCAEIKKKLDPMTSPYRHADADNDERARTMCTQLEARTRARRARTKQRSCVFFFFILTDALDPRNTEPCGCEANLCLTHEKERLLGEPRARHKKRASSCLILPSLCELLFFSSSFLISFSLFLSLSLSLSLGSRYIQEYLWWGGWTWACEREKREHAASK